MNMELDPIIFCVAIVLQLKEDFPGVLFQPTNRNGFLILAECHGTTGFPTRASDILISNCT